MRIGRTWRRSALASAALLPAPCAQAHHPGHRRGSAGELRAARPTPRSPRSAGDHRRVRHLGRGRATCCCRSSCPRARRRCACATATTSPRRRRTRASSTCSTSASTTRAAPGGTVGRGRVPRLGRLEPSRRDGLAQRLLERGRLPRQARRLHRQGKTTRGFLPGPVPAGEWAVELGVAAVASQAEGDARRQGRLAGRDRHQRPIRCGRASPTSPPPYDRAPARSGAGLVRGRLPRARRALLARRRDDARDLRLRVRAASRDCGGAPGGLDFVTLSDYVTDSAWGEIGRFQADYPGKLIARSAEIITYRGHANNHAQRRLRRLPHRPRLRAAGATARSTCAAPRARRAQLFDGIHAGGGFTQINHPTIFPSEVPGFDFLCRGCPWDYDRRRDRLLEGRRDRDRDRPGGAEGGPAAGAEPVHAARDPVLGGRDRRRRPEQQQDRGGRLERLAQRRAARRTPSRSRRSGRRRRSCTRRSSPSGGSSSGVEAGHTYVKLFGNDGPDLRLEARVPGSDAPRGDHGRHRARRGASTSRRA